MSDIGITLVAVLLLLAGCAEQMSAGNASPAFSPPAECDRNGGVWRATHNFCEYQSPGEHR
jgi:hypothetical protein